MDDYFKLNLDLLGGGSSGNIVYNNFHPLWKEAGRLIYNNVNAIFFLKHHAEELNKLIKDPMTISFSEFGLKHLLISGRGLDLRVQEQDYFSHNITSLSDLMGVVAFMNEYFNLMKYQISFLN